MTAIGHIIESEMRSFCAGNLSASDTIRCAEHLELCPECIRLFREVSTVKPVPASGNILLSPETLIIGQHLDYEEISSYLDRKVGQEQGQVIKLHLELCRECAKDMSSLREFRESIESELRGPDLNQGLLYRLVSYWKQVRYFNPVHVFGMLTLMTLLALFGVVAYRWPGSDVAWESKQAEDKPRDSKKPELTETSQFRFDPSGVYTILNSRNKAFDDFDNFQLERLGTEIEGRPWAIGGQLQFGQRSRLEAAFSSVTLNDTALSFATDEVEGISYAFEGRFLRKGGFSKLPKGTPVIEGALIKKVGGQEVAKENLQFACANRDK